MTERTNDMWLTQLNADQPEAVEALRQYLKRGILSYLYSRSDLDYLAGLELDQISEDFTQEVIIKIRDKLHTFKGQSKFTTWATKIASNHTIAQLRRARWRDLSLDVLTEAGTSLQEILSTDSNQISHPDIENERKMAWQAVRSVINNDLTDRQRQVMAAVYFEGIPMAEVARLLDTNTNNVYKLLHDARVKLKKSLRKLGMEPEYILGLFS